MTISQHGRVNGTRPTPPAEPRRPTRAERLATDAEAQARRAAILDQARRDRERRAEEWADERTARREARRAAQKTKRDDARAARAAAWKARLAAWWHGFVLVGAIVGVNIVAVVGQVTAFTAATNATPTGFGWSLGQALATAAVVESIAIYVGWHAHVALVEGDSVMRLRITSYAIAVGVCALNYHHYAPNWEPTDLAVMFGTASLLSPWLWAMHSRHQHRARLREQGLIDPRAPKFSALRWALHRAETWQALKWAVRHGEQSPTAAILAVQIEQGTARSVELEVAETVALPVGSSKELPVSRNDRHVTDEVTDTAPIAYAPAPPSTVTETVTLPVSNSDHDGDNHSDRERPDEQDNRDAEKWIRASMRRGRLPKLSDVRDKYPYSHGWAQARVRTVREEMTAKGYRVLPGNVVKPPVGPVTADDQDPADEVTESGEAP